MKISKRVGVEFVILALLCIPACSKAKEVKRGRVDQADWDTSLEEIAKGTFFEETGIGSIMESVTLPGIRLVEWNTDGTKFNVSGENGTAFCHSLRTRDCRILKKGAFLFLGIEKLFVRIGIGKYQISLIGNKLESTEKYVDICRRSGMLDYYTKDNELFFLCVDIDTRLVTIQKPGSNKNIGVLDVGSKEDKNNVQLKDGDYLKDSCFFGNTERIVTVQGSKYRAAVWDLKKKKRLSVLANDGKNWIHAECHGASNSVALFGMKKVTIANFTNEKLRILKEYKSKREFTEKLKFLPCKKKKRVAILQVDASVNGDDRDVWTDIIIWDYGENTIVAKKELKGMGETLSLHPKKKLMAVGTSQKLYVLKVHNMCN